MTDPNLLMIPGPIGLTPQVLAALGTPQRGHLDPVFMKAFGSALKRLRAVFSAPAAQPFVVAGSGTLAMELAVANLVQPGDRALVVNSGYFSDRVGRMLALHGADVTHVRAEPGDLASLEDVERALKGGGFKVMTITHVDTSTAVLAPVQALAVLGRANGALVVVDGVCSVGGEALDMEGWGVDVAFTASQKALGAPPGLGVLLASPRAMETFRARTHPVAAMYLDFAEWLPIMQAYEAGAPSYFATPAVNLVLALDVSLGQLLDETMPVRTARHVALARAARAAWAALGLAPVPRREALLANTLSALRYPAGVDAALVKHVAAQGVNIAGGLHPALKTTSFRVGHMGSIDAVALLGTIAAVERGLRASGYGFDVGAGVVAAQRALG
ncbi:MAG: alanine--glyoxylate aminotransferase family protein [Myxococcaceae bacterium]|jgi:alanine-glyoxylate transaminase/serine-glyoxylate transaminase/serine-pyruvate transaminase|nr:alanine--glyoxylate aminotransferase family protein [Myxococcaceae bacterium]MCA3013981.1 alanine--glyoxylate aminotransferase family protein [Myxococcaceae bacterium]